MNQVGASRLRGFVASLLALVLSVSVLAVVASSPAGAANTASEALLDPDNDPTTPGVRQFAGANRYATSLALAQAYVEEANSRGFVDSLILVSGESLIDAATAAGLSAARTAPVMLTTPNRLSRAIENFIVDEFIADVVIIGGTDSISQAVEDDLNDLDGVATVTRVSGSDRYSTSAAVAEEITTVGEYCNTAQVSAMVVNADSSFADVIAAGPLAYANELPILLTAADSLPADVASYLTSAEIERVIIVGGTAAVSQAVVDEIIDAGVSDITRISGEDRFATAVAVRTAIAECDGVDLDTATAALINADAAADGVSAAPLLALGLGDDEDVTPVLLVTAEGLPAGTEAFLSGLPIRDTAGAHVDIQLTAIGGEAAIPAAVMQAALDAAVTAEPLTATIKARPMSTTATITFSSPVDATTAENEAFYTLNGNALLVQDTAVLAGNTVTLTLDDSYQYRAGDVIAIAGGRVKGADTDGRMVGATSFTVVADPPDNLRPRVTIFAPDNGHELRLQVTDTGLSDTVLEESHIRERVMLDGTPLSEIDGVSLQTDSTSSSYRICLFGGSSNCVIPPPAGRSLLSAGDQITVAADTFRDRAGNPSRTTIARVVANNPKPVVTRATVTEPVPYDPTPATPGGTVDASWSWTDGNGPDNSANEAVNYLTITAKADGIAGGAAGNAWSLDWFAMSADTNDAPQASVAVFAKRKIIRISFDDDASLYTVVAALLEHDTVMESFTVTSDVLTNRMLGNMRSAGAMPADTDPLVFDPANVLTRMPTGQMETGKPVAARRNLTGGESAVTLRLVSSDILEGFCYEEITTNDDWTWPNDPPSPSSLVTEISIVLHATSLDNLPSVGDTLTLPSGLLESYLPVEDGVTSDPATIRLRAG